MNRYILITITFGLTKNAFVADISDQKIREDWLCGTESIVRRHLPRYRVVQEVLDDPEFGPPAIAAELATLRMSAVESLPGHDFDPKFLFSLSKDFAPSRQPDEHIGCFPIWHL